MRTGALPVETEPSMTEQGTSSIDARIRWQVNEDGVGIARICRPEKRNALTRSMWRSLRDIFRAAGTSTEVRAVVLTGDGGHFCAGADIAEAGRFLRPVVDTCRRLGLACRIQRPRGEPVLSVGSR